MTLSIDNQHELIIEKRGKKKPAPFDVMKIDNPGKSVKLVKNKQIVVDVEVISTSSSRNRSPFYRSN